MMRTLCIAIISMWPANSALATPLSTSYTAFDLASGTLQVQMPAGAHPSPSLVAQGCHSTEAGSVLTIDRQEAFKCSFIFSNVQPSTLYIELTLGGSFIQLPLAFDPGTAGVVAATGTRDDKNNFNLNLANHFGVGEIAYFSRAANQWTLAHVDTGKGFAVLDPTTATVVAENDKFYFRLDHSADVYDVAWKLAGSGKPSRMPPVGECKLSPQTMNYDWSIVFDAANPEHDLGETGPIPQQVVLQHGDLTGTLSAVVVSPNKVGVLIVRHWDSDRVVFDGSGAPVALSTPATANSGTAQADDGKAKVATTPPPSLPTASVCEYKPVAPHAPGPFTVTVKITDGADATKVLSARTIDLITEQRYSGAFRVGVAGILFADDQNFTAETFPNSPQAEIVRSSKVPAELVIGYSQFFDGLGDGRSYIDRQWYQRFGIYVGVGVLGFSTSSIDFLKSMHVGFEFEISQSMSIALTAVGRRVNELADNIHVGAPVPSGGIPTQTGYVPGMAVILNITPSFFRFATSLAK
jgi:hypothetical protein